MQRKSRLAAARRPEAVRKNPIVHNARARRYPLIQTNHRPLQLVLLTIALVGAGLAHAEEEVCEPIFGDGPQCPVDKYAMLRKSTDDCSGGLGGDGISKGKVVCKAWNLAPGHVDLECLPAPGGFNCHVWPRSVLFEAPLAYRYIGGGNINAGSSSETGDNTRYVSCGSGVPSTLGELVVEVISPFGLASSHSIGLNCNQGAPY
jgi:hypothetical protein